jgi:hypothetical protein
MPGLYKQSRLKEDVDMPVTLEELAQRLDALEHQVRALCVLLNPAPAHETLAQRGERLQRESRASQAAISAGMDDLYKQFGIPRDLKPRPIQEIRQQMIAEGVKPEDCSFSREIIAMRDE